MKKIAIISENATNISFNDCKIISLPCASHLPPPLSYHADMLLFIGFNTLFTHTEYYKSNKNIIDETASLLHLSLCVSDEYTAQSYPHDVLFNAVLLKDKLICNKKTVSKHILEHAEKHNCEIINVNQGYTKCSTLIVSDNAIITSDIKIHKEALGHNIESLLISCGGIELLPYEYGFIGGTSGYDENNIYFYGDISKHQDYNAIKEFVQSHNKNIVTLNNGRLCDIGSIFIYNI